jgi:hypothetical protein
MKLIAPSGKGEFGISLMELDFSRSPNPDDNKIPSK